MFLYHLHLGNQYLNFNNHFFLFTFNLINFDYSLLFLISFSYLYPFNFQVVYLFLNFINLIKFHFTVHNRYFESSKFLQFTLNLIAAYFTYLNLHYLICYFRFMYFIHHSIFSIIKNSKKSILNNHPRLIINFELLKIHQHPYH